MELRGLLCTKCGRKCGSYGRVFYQSQWFSVILMQYNAKAHIVMYLLEFVRAILSHFTPHRTGLHPSLIPGGGVTLMMSLSVGGVESMTTETVSVNLFGHSDDDVTWGGFIRPAFIRSFSVHCVTWTQGVYTVPLTWTQGVYTVPLTWTQGVYTVALIWTQGVYTVALTWTQGVYTVALIWIGVRSSSSPQDKHKPSAVSPFGPQLYASFDSQ